MFMNFSDVVRDISIELYNLRFEITRIQNCGETKGEIPGKKTTMIIEMSPGEN